MNIDNYKHIIANEKGYPSWDTMEDFIIDHNKPVHVAILIKGAIEEVYERYMKDELKHEVKYSTYL